MQIQLEKPRKNSYRTEKRLKSVHTAVHLFERFYKNNYRVKKDVFIQLIMNFPKYNTEKGKDIFTQLWHFKSFDNRLLNDLLYTIDKIEEKRL